MPYTLAGHVTATDTDDGLVLLDERTGKYWQLNTTGATVLRCLLAGGTPEAAARELRERYPGAPAERIGADVDAVLSTLRSRKLVAA